MASQSSRLLLLALVCCIGSGCTSSGKWKIQQVRELDNADRESAALIANQLAAQIGSKPVVAIASARIIEQDLDFVVVLATTSDRVSEDARYIARTILYVPNEIVALGTTDGRIDLSIIERNADRDSRVSFAYPPPIKWEYLSQIDTQVTIVQKFTLRIDAVVKPTDPLNISFVSNRDYERSATSTRFFDRFLVHSTILPVVPAVP